MTTVYFVRHAEPNRSADSIYNDRTYPLSQKGLVDRKLVTSFLQNKNIDVVLSSPYKRAVDTVAEFAEKNELVVEIIEDFRERKIADVWIDDFFVFAKKQWTDFSYKQPEGESISEVQERNIAALKDVLNRYAGKNIVVGTHGQALSAIINYYDGSYGFDDFKAMAHIMPWIVRMVFEGDKCSVMTKINLFDQEFYHKNGSHRVITADLGTLEAYHHTVVFTRYEGKWLYCRHKNRNVFEAIGGRIDYGETPLECAKRELYEETGATKFFIHPAFDYVLYTNMGFANGQVFYADIKELGELPSNFEMAEIKGFQTLPENTRFPQSHSVLYERIDKWLVLEKIKVKIVYRLATVNDVNRLAELIWELKNEDSPLDLTEKSAFIQICSEHLKQRLGDDYFCWVAEVDGLIISHMNIIITRKLPKPGNLNSLYARLSLVRTIPKYRNMGIGSALLEKVKEWCRVRNVQELVVWPSDQSVLFYERAGFKGENKIMEIEWY